MWVWVYTHIVFEHHAIHPKDILERVRIERKYLLFVLDTCRCHFSLPTQYPLVFHREYIIARTV